jgi:hypothetical protein
MKRFFAHDDFAFGLENIERVFDMYSPLKSSFTFKGQLVDTDDFDIIPKKHYTDRKIKEKEQEIANLQDQKNHYIKRIDEQIENARIELDTLRGYIKPKIDKK